MQNALVEQIVLLAFLLVSGLGSVWALTNLGFGTVWVLGVALVACLSIVLMAIVAMLRDHDELTFDR